MSKFVFGIDLGTTYSCIAYVDESGRPVVIPSAEGPLTTPSVVYFEGEDNVTVGQVAKDSEAMDPDNTLAFVKRFMGKQNITGHTFNGHDVSPEEASSYILKKLAKDASDNLGTEVKDVVITCPAYFGMEERQATKNAGEIAGLNVLEIINEPTAAALFYGCTKNQDEKTVLVFDLGGGTFDVTVMAISDQKIEILASDGQHELGGKDWDDAIIGYLMGEFKEANDLDDDFEFDDSDVAAIKAQAEKAKIQLSKRNSTPVMVQASGFRTKIELTIEKFDEITSSYLNLAIDTTDKCIDIAKSKGYDKIDEILLVGGSTRMTQVSKKVKEKYNIEPKILDPDEAVAKGAAIHAVNVYINNQKSLDPNAIGKQEVEVAGTKKEIDADDYKEDLAVDETMLRIGGSAQEIISATTKSFAVECLNQDNKKICDNLIIKNEPMPNGVITAKGTYGTESANQLCVCIKVYESDYMDKTFDVDESLFLGECELELPPNLPANSPIEVTFSLNNEGILTVTGIDKTSNKDVKTTMKAKGIMGEEQVQELKEQSKGITVM